MPAPPAAATADTADTCRAAPGAGAPTPLPYYTEQVTFAFTAVLFDASPAALPPDTPTAGADSPYPRFAAIFASGARAACRRAQQPLRPSRRRCFWLLLPVCVIAQRISNQATLLEVSRSVPSRSCTPCTPCL